MNIQHLLSELWIHPAASRSHAWFVTLSLTFGGWGHGCAVSFPCFNNLFNVALKFTRFKVGYVFFFFYSQKLTDTLKSVLSPFYFRL